MALYQFQCPSCSHLWSEWYPMSEIEAAKPGCPNCQSGIGVQQYGRHSLVFFKEGFYPNIDLEPIHCSSAQQLHDECEKRGLYSNYVEESSAFTVRRHRWI